MNLQPIESKFSSKKHKRGGNLRPKSSAKPAAQLLSFTPKFPLPENEYYVKHLKEAISNRDIRNIGLFGDYGTGKSSIIQQLLSEKLWKSCHKTKIISLMSLNLEKTSSEIVKNSSACKEAQPQDDSNTQPVSAIPRSAEQTDEKHSTIQNAYENLEQKSKTRRLVQNEILKQLFYGEKPEKLRNSRFYRIYRISNPEIFLVTIALSALFSPTIRYILESILPTSMLNLAAFTSLTVLVSLLSYLTITAICVSCAVVLTALAQFLLSLRGKSIANINISKLGINLSDQKLDFKHAYDELIYFFQATKYQVIIFEDLDRFNDKVIFEELRRLNFMINSSKLIHHKVTFVYAMHASLISDPQDRNKIFDINIGIVPFLTTENSLEKIRSIFITKAKFSEEVQPILKLLARHIFDMRTIKAICNNAIIIRDKVFTNKTSGILNESEAISIAAIQELSPIEYEKMRRGSSLIDEILECGKEAKHQAAKDSATDLFDRTKNLDTLVKKASEDLWKYIKDTYGSTAPSSITANGKTFNPDSIIDTAFWNRVANGQDTDIFATYGQYGSAYNITKSDLLGTEYNDIKRLLRLLTNSEQHLADELNNIQTKDPFSFVAKLLQESNEVSQEGLKTSEAKSKIELKELTDSIPVNIKLFLKELIKSGILTQNYHLYLAPFAELSGSDQLKSFRTRCLDRNASDFTAELSNEDIQELLADADETELSSPAFYNINILRYLAKSDNDDYDKKLKIILSSTRYNPEFFELYEMICIMENLHPDESDNKSWVHYLTIILAQYCPIQTLRTLANTGVISEYFRKELFIEALSQSNLSGLTSAPDPQKQEIINLIYRYEKDIIATNGAKHLSQILIENQIPTKKLSLYKQFPEVLNDLLRTKCFEINSDSLSAVDFDTAITILKDTELTDDILSDVFSNRRLITINENLIKNAPEYHFKIQEHATITLIIRFIERRSIIIDYDSISTMLSETDTDDKLKLLLLSNVDRNQMLQVLAQLDEPYSSIKLRGRPTLFNTSINRKLIKRLQKLDLISSVDENSPRDTIRFNMKNR